MNIVQRQLGLIPSIVTKDAKGEYIQALIDSREQEDSTIVQDVMLTQHTTNLENRILQYQQSMDDTAKAKSDTVNDTATPKDTTARLIAAIKEHPEYTYDEYAKLLNVGRATVARHIKKLNGTVIQRIGSDKDGYWKFIE
jgi:predicted HTH transcriptional regulator